MKKLALTLLIVFGLWPLAGYSQISQKLADTLQATLEHRAKLYQLKSVAAAIVFPDGSLWEGVQGNSGTVPTNSSMLFEMGSNTKTFTSSIILQMADEGKLKLNDTIYKFLPVHPNIAYGITIRQLLNHTNGIYNYTEHPDFFSFVNGDPDVIISVDTMLKYWVKPMINTPGAKYSYCNTGYLLLGRIIEKIDGVPYHESLRNRLLNKYGFTESFLDVYDNYSLTKTGIWFSNGQYYDGNIISFMSAAWAAGAIITTPRDLAKWAKALYHGDILPGRWLDSMRVTIPAGNGYRYGLGMFQYTTGGKTYLGHGGTTLQNSEMTYSVSSDFSCVTVINEQNTGGEAFQIQSALNNLVEKLLPGISSIESFDATTSINYYPNPATDRFTVSLNEQETQQGNNLSLNIYSMAGKLVKSVPFEAPQISIDRDGLSSGIYLLKIQASSGDIIARNKLVLK